MRFLLDESAGSRYGSFLSGRGDDVATIARNHVRGLPDREVLAIAVREERILITFDQDFGTLVFGENLPHLGIILFRLRTKDPRLRLARLDHVLTHHADVLDRFLVVTDFDVRIVGSPKKP